MRIEYDMWKAENPDQDFSQEDYRMAAVNMNAFEYSSIEDQQLNKEFWVSIGAAVVIVGVAVICPPAGLALGAAYGTLELSSAVSGKDWLTSRELGTGERWLRGALAPLDIVPGVAGLKKFGTGVRLSNQVVDMGQMAIKPGLRSAVQREITHVGDMLNTAGAMTVQRVKNAGSAVRDASRVARDKVVRDIQDVGRLADSAVTSMKNMIPTRTVLAADDVGRVHLPGENTRLFDDKAKEMFSKAEGIGTSGPVEEALRQANISKDELFIYLKSIDEKLADNYLQTGKWPEEIQIPKDSGVLNKDGTINWAEVPQGGYILDKNGEAIKEVFTPSKGEIIDRYGPPNGRYTSPVPDGVPYNYEQRSLPYVEDPSKYHKYEVIGDFKRLEDYIKNRSDIELQKNIENLVVRYYNGDYSKLTPLRGDVAQGFGSPGGAVQYELPLPVEWLEKLGLLKEIK